MPEALVLTACAFPPSASEGRGKSTGKEKKGRNSAREKPGFPSSGFFATKRPSKFTLVFQQRKVVEIGSKDERLVMGRLTWTWSRLPRVAGIDSVCPADCRCCPA